MKNVSTSPLRVGVIGCGGIAQMMHLPFLAERPDLFAIESLADVDAKALEAVGRRYRVERLHTDHRQLLADPIDAVVILAGDSHRGPAVDAARAGKHILCEKPLGENLQEVEDVAAAVREAGVTLMVGYHKRYDPGYRFARDEVRKLADLRFVRVDVLHPVDARARDHYFIEPPPDAQQVQRGNSEATDGLVSYATQGAPRPRIEAIVGADAPVSQRVATFLLFNSLIHDVNALRGILGEPEDVVSAEVWRGGRALHVVLRWPADVRAALSWVYLPGLSNYKEQLLFASPEARVTIDFPSPYFKHFPTPILIERMEQGRVVQQQVRVSLEEAFRSELHHFHECVRTGQQPETGIDEARGDTLVLERIARLCR